MNQNLKKAKAIEQKNRERLLELNPNLNDGSGIYFLLREDENGFKYAYVGQAKHILKRLCGHLTGYQQHIDLSLKKHKLYSERNLYGWRLEFMNFPESELDEKEKFYIKKYANAGYQLRNVSLGGQGPERSCGQINEQKSAKGYRNGIIQGKKILARELSSIIDTHLQVTLKPEKQNNKTSIKMLEKFERLIDENEYS